MDDEKQPILSDDYQRPKYGGLFTTRNRESQKTKYGFTQLINDYGTIWDKIFLVVGIILTIASGLSLALLGLMYGTSANVFIVHQNVSAANRTDAQRSAFSDATTDVLMRFLLLTIGTFIVFFFSSMSLLIPSARIVNELRRRFLSHIVRADMAYLETQRTGELNAMFHDHMERVLEALCNYGYEVLLQLSSAIFGVIISLVINWQQSLCAGTLMPIIALIGVYAMRVVVRQVEEEQRLFGKVAALVNETLGNIPTVLSFNGQSQTLIRFNQFLTDANVASARRALVEGIGNGLDTFVADSMAGVAFLFGALFAGSYTDLESRGMIYAVAINLMLAATMVGQIQAPLSSFLGAKANLGTIGKILQTEPNIDSLSNEGEQPMESSHGGATIEFRDVTFAYPTRPDIKVLNGVSFTVSAGEHVAIVGSSGAGKSTIANLILRFYETNAGTILVNNRPLTAVNLQSWRRLIGYVSQEAPIFDGTVEENISLGSQDATREKVVECIRQANLEKFIEELPEGYDTWVGDKGVQLSGGQRQRVAIARALIREPAVFVFDEATSSLDSVTEQTVVGEIENVVRGKTTVTIAHRLSTIRNADRIIVLDQGNIVEQGHHDELMNLNKKYAQMVHLQELDKDEADTDWISAASGGGNISSYSETSDPEMYFSDVSRRKLTKRRGFSSDTGGEGLGRMSTDDVSSALIGMRRKSSVIGGSGIARVKATPARRTVETFKSVDEAEKEKADEDELEKRETDFNAFFGMFTRNDWCRLALSFVGSFIFSVSDTVCCIAYAAVLMVLPLKLNDMRDGVILIASVNIISSAIGAIGRAFFTYWHNRFGDESSRRMHTVLFTKLLRENLSFYDRPENSSGTLSTILVKNPAKMRKAINQDMLLMPSAVWSFALRTIVALYLNPLYALICMLMIPCEIAVYILMMCINVYLESKVQPEQEKAGKIATEIIDNVSTVQAYSLERLLCSRYDRHLQPVLWGFIKQGVVSAAFTGVICAMDSLWLGILFKIGSWFVASGDMTFIELWIVFLIVGTLSEELSLLLGQSPDVVRGMVSAAKAVSIINQPTDVDCMSETGLTPKIEGGIKVKGVRFSYPARPDVEILADVTANIKIGKTLAIVGPSGSGKSTIMHLLQRLYDPTKGKIEIDGYGLENINIRCLRRNIVPVRQEPVLLDGTIRENIMYGLEDENVDNSQLFNASRMANVHDFVSSLPEGYNTDVGAKGVQLSGGQRQRIAIARALVRNPKVLLLDEATASLDTENEQAVQAALEVARKERTCVVVAHRLSTVQSAHMILVMVDGRIVERGNHRTLLEKQGVYYDLCLKQKLAA